MNHTQLKQTLTELIQAWENEVSEFKEAGNDYSTHDIGKYSSALANEANLRGKGRNAHGGRDKLPGRTRAASIAETANRFRHGTKHHIL